MNLLAFDTSSTACSVALLFDEKISFRHTIAPMQQSKLILPMIHELFSEKNITLKQVDAIAFGCGPGSFTGVRLATSVAQGLGFAGEKPLIPISSLAATAQTAYQELGWEKIVVAIDARVNEIYWAYYTVESQALVKLIGQERLSTPDLMSISEENWYGVGNAWDVYQQQITLKPLKKDITCLANACAILELANKQGVMMAPSDALPVYLRDDIAKKAVK